MRKLVPSLLALAAFAAPLHAQAGFGVLGGFVSSNITTSHNDGTFSNSSRSGFAIGVSADGLLAPSVTLGADAMYVEKGAKFTGSGSSGSLKVGYIDVPVRLKLLFGSPSTKLFILGGPEVGFKVSCSNDFNIGVSGSSGCGAAENDAIKGTDFGVTFGAGVLLSQFSISARYDLGLTDINSSDNANNPNYRNHAFLILAGLHFGPMGPQ